LPLLNIIGELLCLTLPALFVLAFSTPAQSYFIFPYLHFPSLHIYTCFFRTCIFIRPVPTVFSTVIWKSSQSARCLIVRQMAPTAQ